VSPASAEVTDIGAVVLTYLVGCPSSTMSVVLMVADFAVLSNVIVTVLPPFAEQLTGLQVNASPESLITVNDFVAGKPLVSTATEYVVGMKFAVIVPVPPIVAVVDADVGLVMVIDPVLLLHDENAYPALTVADIESAGGEAS
jgi:hypothetical protein